MGATSEQPHQPVEVCDDAPQQTAAAVVGLLAGSGWRLSVLIEAWAFSCAARSLQGCWHQLQESLDNSRQRQFQ